MPLNRKGGKMGDSGIGKQSHISINTLASQSWVLKVHYFTAKTHIFLAGRPINNIYNMANTTFIKKIYVHVDL